MPKQSRLHPHKLCPHCRQRDRELIELKPTIRPSLRLVSLASKHFAAEIWADTERQRHEHRWHILQARNELRHRCQNNHQPNPNPLPDNCPRDFDRSLCWQTLNASHSRIQEAIEKRKHTPPKFNRKTTTAA